MCVKVALSSLQHLMLDMAVHKLCAFCHLQVQRVVRSRALRNAHGASTAMSTGASCRPSRINFVSHLALTVPGEARQAVTGCSSKTCFEAESIDVVSARINIHYWLRKPELNV